MTVLVRSQVPSSACQVPGAGAKVPSAEWVPGARSSLHLHSALGTRHDPAPGTRHSAPQVSNSSGFTTLELLIASALLLAVFGAVAAMAIPLRDAFERSLGAADLTGGSRAVLERLTAEVREAGSAAAVGVGRVRLADLLPVIIPLSDLDAGSVTNPARAVRITRIPFLAPQGVLQADAGIGTVLLQVETVAPCSAVGFACGLRAGVMAVLYDETRATTVGVDSVADGGVVRLGSPLTMAFGRGAVIAAVSVTAYGLRSDPDGSSRLVRATQGAEQPLLQSVVDFEVAVHGVDPLHIRQVDFRLRVEAPSAAMRGPVGRLFRRPGSSRRAAQWVPDIELRASVAARSLN